MAVVSLFPIAWMLSTVFKPKSALFATPPQWVPVHPTLANIGNVVTNPVMQRYAMNSLIVSLSTAFLGVCVAVLAGYSLSRFPFKGQDLVLVFLLATQMFPLAMLLIPLFRLWSSLGMLNTYVSLIGTHLTVVVPLGVWLMKSYFDTIPGELEDAAAVDGSGMFRTLVSIVLPLAAPGVVVVGLFGFLQSWDEYLFTFTLISQDSMRTLPVGMVTQYLGQFSYAWGPLMTLSLAMSVPVMLVFLFFQRYIVEGLVAGSVK